MDLTDVELSWRVEENTYEDNTTLQVAWVAEPDASPTRTVSKISKEDAQALQARYASVLAATKTPTKAVSAKGKKGAKATAKVTSEKVTKGKKPAGRPTATKPKVTPEVTHSAPAGKCSADDAYNACYELKRDDVTEERLNELWQKMVAKVNADETKITEEEWFQIKEKLLKVTTKV